MAVHIRRGEQRESSNGRVAAQPAPPARAATEGSYERGFGDRRRGPVRPDHRTAGGGVRGRPGRDHRCAQPHRRQRVQLYRRGDRCRNPPIRCPPVPYFHQTRLGLRQPLHRIHRLRASRVRHARRRGLPAANQSRHHQPVLPGGLHARRGEAAHRRAGR